MRSRQHAPAPPRRRSASEWARLVAELHESGLSPEVFAAARGVPLSRLRWWKWHLASGRSPAATPDELRLVPVVVEPAAPPASPPLPPPALAWEVCTVRGDLRVYRATAPAEIQAALDALLAPGGRR